LAVDECAVGAGEIGQAKLADATSHAAQRQTVTITHWPTNLSHIGHHGADSQGIKFVRRTSSSYRGNLAH